MNCKTHMYHTSYINRIWSMYYKLWKIILVKFSFFMEITIPHYKRYTFSFFGKCYGRKSNIT